MSDSSCKRVLLLSCGQIFSPVFPVFFRNVTVIYDFLSFLFIIIVYVEYELLSHFPVIL